LGDEVGTPSGTRVSPALMLQATCAAGVRADRLQVRGVTVLGVDASFFDSSPPPRFGEKGLAWLNHPVAEALGVAAGDRITLRLQKPGDVPREAALGKKEIQFEDWELDLAGVLGEDTFGAAFSLRPHLPAPRHLLVHLPQLQERLSLKGQVNALLAAGTGKALT